MGYGQECSSFDDVWVEKSREHNFTFYYSPFSFVQQLQHNSIVWQLQHTTSIINLLHHTTLSAYNYHSTIISYNCCSNIFATYNFHLSIATWTASIQHVPNTTVLNQSSLQLLLKICSSTIAPIINNCIMLLSSSNCTILISFKSHRIQLSFNNCQINRTTNNCTL